jgi:hypothetical protein
MFSVATNTPLKSSDITVRGGAHDSEILESGIPILCKGLATDKNGNIWIHNSNSGKLTKYNKLSLTPIVEFEGSSDIHMSKD